MNRSMTAAENSYPMEPAGLYIHVPFCRRKCAYCDFYSITGTAGLTARWLAALNLEASMYRSSFPAFDTVYIGGGTPSILDADLLEVLMDRVVSWFSLNNGAEITIEANPCDIDQEKILLFQRMGFTRINLGVQSLSADVLQFLGRSHSVETAAAALAQLESKWPHSFGVDMIYGVPGQSENHWLGDLEKALAFGPDHVSCYQLSIEKGTRLYKLHAEGKFRLPGESFSAGLFTATSDFMASHGYMHYEVSNFAATASVKSRHNLKYWHHVPYLGLGPSAHSFDGSRRWWNARSVKRYCDALESNTAPVEGAEVLSESDLTREAVFLGLRTSEGIALELVPETKENLIFLEKGRHMRFLEIRDGKIIPTAKGLLVADYLALSLC
ncbi:MAG TPA: radical SAM family heme chaperone HemW [Desulfobacteraceae bacterium]|nr:radical SAM family heme chaperone HemW [Desulfobacteraceae bacterium]